MVKRNGDLLARPLDLLDAPPVSVAANLSRSLWNSRFQVRFTGKLVLVDGNYKEVVLVFLVV